MRVLITGSEGLVGAQLVKMLEGAYDLLCLDRVACGANNSIKVDLNNLSQSTGLLDQLQDQEVFLIHLAAARFDFGVNAYAYYRDNVEATKGLLSLLSEVNLVGVIHISSVASIDGSEMSYNDSLSCDDAYRVTKYLQEKVVSDYCEKYNVPLWVLSPSAIFTESSRGDTNIGKLQSVARKFPILPSIGVYKSLTFLPHFNSFIAMCLAGEVQQGKYLTIETPCMAVSDMLSKLSKGKTTIVYVPMLKHALYMVSWVAWVVCGFGRIDPKLTPNRVCKLYRDTSYRDQTVYDADCYPQMAKSRLGEILESI